MAVFITSKSNRNCYDLMADAFFTCFHKCIQQVQNSLLIQNQILTVGTANQAHSVVYLVTVTYPTMTPLSLYQTQIFAFFN